MDLFRANFVYLLAVFNYTKFALSSYQLVPENSTTQQMETNESLSRAIALGQVSSNIMKRKSGQSKKLFFEYEASLQDLTITSSLLSSLPSRRSTRESLAIESIEKRTNERTVLNNSQSKSRNIDNIITIQKDNDTMWKTARNLTNRHRKINKRMDPYKLLLPRTPGGKKVTPRIHLLVPIGRMAKNNKYRNQNYIYRNFSRNNMKSKDKQRQKEWKTEPPLQSDSAANSFDDSVRFVPIDNKIDEHDGGRLSAIPQYLVCEELNCGNEGICIGDTIRGGVRCRCNLGSSGEKCDKDIIVQYPKFLGGGFLAFPTLQGADKYINIIIEFRADTGNGLLLFSGQFPNALSDFISITLVDGHVEFRFDCGTGLAIITTLNKVHHGEWNNIKAYRIDEYGWLELNSGPRADGRSSGSFNRITFRQDLFLGGYNNMNAVSGRTGMQWGFVGCVRILNINGKSYDMRKGAFVGDTIYGIDVGECSENVCDNIKCYNGGTCVVDTVDTASCLCPLGSAGSKCESKVDVYQPEFSGNSYLRFIGLGISVSSSCDIEIVIKPKALSGLILYNGYMTDQSGDFISLALIDGYLEYCFDLGTGPSVIRSRRAVKLEEWYTVRLARTGKEGWLQVDNDIAVFGSSSGDHTQLTLSLDLFVGGHRNYDEVSSTLGIRTSFKGCVQKVLINGQPLKLLTNALTAVNIVNCYHSCVDHPCQSGKICMDHYQCDCSTDFQNINCIDNELEAK